MNDLDVFYQGDDLREIRHLQINVNGSFGDLKNAIIAVSGEQNDVELYVEDEEDPVSDCTRLSDRDIRKGLRVHVSRCRSVTIEVTYNGQVESRKFSPALTIAKVKRWATRHGFDMSKEEAGEHALQIGGTHDRPSLNTHVGALTNPTTCSIDFDLVPDERINGAGAY